MATITPTATYLLTVEDENGTWWEPIGEHFGSELELRIIEDFGWRSDGYDNGTYEGLVPYAYKVWQQTDATSYRVVGIFNSAFEQITN